MIQDYGLTAARKEFNNRTHDKIIIVTDVGCMVPIIHHSAFVLIINTVIPTIEYKRRQCINRNAIIACIPLLPILNK